MRRFQKLEKEIVDEIKNSISTEIIEKSFKEISEKIEQTADNKVL